MLGMVVGWGCDPIIRWVGGELREVSVEEADSFYGHADGHATRDFMPVGGYGRLVQHYARDVLPLVRLGHRVALIRSLPADSSSGRGLKRPRVRLEAAQEGMPAIEARCVIVTASVGVLRAGRALRFEPPLPRAKQEALSRLAMGVFNKVFLHFPRAFWPADTDVFGFVPPAARTSGAHPSLVINLLRVDPSHRPVLVGLYAGADAWALENLSDEEVVGSFMALLRRAWGPELPAPVRHVVTRWASDELALGTYTYLHPGGSDKDRREYAAPLDGSIFFAGEGTSVDHSACVDGACQTGYRAAEEVFRELKGSSL